MEAVRPAAGQREDVAVPDRALARARPFPRGDAPAAARPPRRRRFAPRRVVLVGVPLAILLAAAGALVGGLVTSGGSGRRATPTVVLGSADHATHLRAAVPPAPKSAAQGSFTE